VKRHFYIVLLMLLSITVQGQIARTAPFSTIEWFAGQSLTIKQNELNDYYRYAGGVSMNARTPFYFGSAELGINVHSYSEYKSIEFYQVHCYLAFLKEITVFKKPSVDLGVTIGNSFFQFDTEENKALQNESELTLGISGGFKIPMGYHWLFRATISHVIVFTYHQIETTNLGFQIGYKIRTPDWLKNFLK